MLHVDRRILIRNLQPLLPSLLRLTHDYNLKVFESLRQVTLPQQLTFALLMSGKSHQVRRDL